VSRDSGKQNPTTKLLAAFESEERRYKDNELRYAEKIKSLTNELYSERQKREKDQERQRELEEKVTHYKLDLKDTLVIG
jgi:predicted nucleic acid-binding protein